MTEEQILDIVKKAGYPLTVYEGKPYVPPMLEILLETAAVAEREACAKIVELNADACRSDGVAQMILYSNAAAIRARGENV